MNEHECKECVFVCSTKQGLGQHIRRWHGGIKSYLERNEPRFCARCNKLIPYTQGKTRRYNKKVYCNSKCYGRAHGFRLGPDHPDWKGGRRKSGGYIHVLLNCVPEEDANLFRAMMNKRGTVKEHRYVMAKSLGRPLTKSETVHHRNGIRHDNRLENLELWHGKHPPGIKAGDIMCPCCGYVFNRDMNGYRDSK